MKCRVRYCEKVWQKYREEHQWTAYKAVRKEYTWKTRLAWAKHMKDQILKLKGETKGLYKLIAKLTGLISESPLPAHASDMELTDEFGRFLYWKN